MTLPIDLRVKFNSIQWLKSHGYSLPLATRARAIKAGVLPSREIKGADGYMVFRNELWASVYEAVYDYLTGDGSMATYKNAMKKAVTEAYNDAADMGYSDGGGDLPMDEDTQAWVAGEQSAQLGYVDSLFQTLKGLKKEADFDAQSEASDRADGYTNSLDGLYNGAKLAGAGNQMLTFDGDDGAESCDDCQRYKGQRHRASWWISHNAVPPSRSFVCGGYHCAHRLYDDSGEEFTI